MVLCWTCPLWHYGFCNGKDETPYGCYETLKEVKIKMELHQKFEKWHPKNLVDLLNFIKERYPIKFEVIMHDYDEMLMGN